MVNIIIPNNRKEINRFFKDLFYLSVFLEVPKHKDATKKLLAEHALAARSAQSLPKKEGNRPGLSPERNEKDKQIYVARQLRQKRCLYSPSVV